MPTFILAIGNLLLSLPVGPRFIIPDTGLRFPRLPFSTYQELTLLTLDVTYISLSKVVHHVPYNLQKVVAFCIPIDLCFEFKS